ncbi:hypothetical protein CC2G_011177 [Coprinopsis cinerea AmutBmut pab1-1]|nr:hypothetical protein CC2G_011177 [Coprinopsis cinerea AmutBmut pab1-1]
MYYIGLLTCTIVNLSTHNSAIGIGPLHLLQRAMHAILANRLLLDTRRQFKANYIGPGGSTAVVSDLKFKNTQASRRGQNTTWNEMGTVGLGGGGGDGLQDSEASRSDGQSELGIVEVRRDENESVPV